MRTYINFLGAKVLKLFQDFNIIEIVLDFFKNNLLQQSKAIPTFNPVNTCTGMFLNFGIFQSGILFSKKEWSSESDNYYFRGFGYSPCIGNRGMCRWRGHGFQAIWSGIGSSNHRKLVYESYCSQTQPPPYMLHRAIWQGIWLLSIPSENPTKYRSQKTEIKNSWAFLVWYRVTTCAKFGLLKGRTFVNPAAHPHPNYIGVPPRQLLLGHEHYKSCTFFATSKNNF